MALPQGSALLQSYHEVCRELNCEQQQEFSECLQYNSRVCRLSHIGQEEQLYSIVSLLPYLDLEELDVSGLQLDANCWVSLAEGISKCRTLQVVSLKGCGLGQLAHTEQSKVAGHIGDSSLAVLDLSQNNLGDGFTGALSTTPLVTQARHLNVLDLSENAITCSGAAVLAASFEASGGSCELRQLDLGFNQVGDEGAAALAALAAATPLVALELEGNKVTDVGGLSLAAVLGGGGSRLQRLNLNNNRMTSETHSALAGALKDGKGPLQELTVAGCQGGDQGVAALFASLKGNTQLQLLDVRGTPVGQAAAGVLCRALTEASSSLVTLRMDVDSKDAAELVAQSLPGNGQLLQLMMGGPVPEHVLSFIGATLSSNSLARLTAANEAAAESSGPLLNTGKGQVRWDPSTNPPASGEGGSFPRQQQQQPGGRSASPSGEGGSSWRSSPQRPASANSGAARRGLERSLTVRAKQLAVLDPSGLAGLAGGGTAQKAAEVFRKHDSDGSGYLDAEEMMSALQDLGMLEGMKPKTLGKFLSNAIKEADTDQDGRVSLTEFVKYYERLARHYADAARQGRIQARSRPPLVPMHATSSDALKRSFKAYCRVPIGQGRQVGGSVQHLNAAQFNLLARDVGLVEPAGPLSQCAVDIIFTRCKPTGSRRLSFKDFLEALALVCEEAGMSFDEVTSTMARTATAPGTPAGGGRSGLTNIDYIMFDQPVVQLGPPPAFVRRGSIGDDKVGPCLPQSQLSSGSGSGSKSSSVMSKLRIKPAAGTRRPRSPNFVHRPASPPVVALRLANRSAESDDSDPRLLSSIGDPSMLRSSYPPADGRGTQQQNPLFELDSTTNSSASRQVDATTKALTLERTAAAARADSIKAAAGDPQGVAAAVLARLATLEEAAAARQAQLDLLIRQQAELQRLVLQLGEGLEAHQGAGASGGAAAQDVAVLKQQVCELSSQLSRVEVAAQAAQEGAAGKANTLELLNVMERKLNARQGRMEDALMQVARQVDVLDLRLKEEQESSLKALEAILGNASPAK